MKKGDVVSILLAQMKREGLPNPETEYQFHPTRKWRFDFAYPDRKIAFEYEGGIWSGGAHTRGQHFKSDCEKYNNAGLLGWTVYRLHCDMIYKGNRELDDGLVLVKLAINASRC